MVRTNTNYADYYVGLYDIENAVGTSLNDRITGSGGANILNGAGGADRLDGSDGNDVAAYIGSAEAVTVNLATGEASGGCAEGDTLIDIEGLSGSEHDDTLTGSDGANQLIGGAGNDLLRGGGGTDTMLGADGNDQMFGEAGDDRLFGSVGADSLDGGDGIDIADYTYSTGPVTIALADAARPAPAPAAWPRATP